MLLHFPTSVTHYQIYAGIAGAHNFIFILSPDSIISRECALEVDCAVKNNKRLVPILYCDVYPEDVHRDLAKINWIFFRECDDFDSSFAQLLKILDTDLDHIKMHTRILLRALEWERKLFDQSFLLRGNDLKQAEVWLKLWITQDKFKEPEPTRIQQRYIATSQKEQLGEERKWQQLYETAEEERKKAEEERKKASIAHKKSEHRQKITIISISIGLVMSVGFAAYALLASFRAEQLRILAEKEQIGAMAKAADALFVSNQEFNSLLESLRAIRKLEDIPIDQRDIQIQETLAKTISHAIYWVQEYNRLEGHSAELTTGCFSPDGKMIATASWDKTIKLWQKDGTLIIAVCKKVRTGSKMGKELKVKKWEQHIQKI